MDLITISSDNKKNNILSSDMPEKTIKKIDSGLILSDLLEDHHPQFPPTNRTENNTITRTI